MPIVPDIATLILCSMLQSIAFAVIFLSLWLGRRGDAHWMYWAGASALYVVTLLAYGIAPLNVFTGGVLHTCLATTTILIVMGVRRFDGLPAYHLGFLLLAAGVGLGYALPAALIPPGSAISAEAAGRIGGEFGLAVTVAVIGARLVRDRRGDASRGRRIAGFGLLAYLPGYALTIVSEGVGWPGFSVVGLLPLLSDQMLLATLNIGLLVMPGERAQAALRDMALRDPLTGCWNRAGLAARTAWSPSAETGVIVIDVDHFKLLNDRYGHVVGDRILTALATCAGAQISRVDDTVARLGGDEFVIVLRRTSLTGTRRFAETLRLALRRAPDLPPWTVSMGIAMADAADAGLTDIVDRADRALYEAKGAGRDRNAA